MWLASHFQECNQHEIWSYIEALMTDWTCLEDQQINNLINYILIATIN